MSENKAMPISRFPMEPVNDLVRASTTGTAPLDDKEVSSGLYMSHYIAKHPTQEVDEMKTGAGFFAATAAGAMSGLSTLAGGPVALVAGATAFWFVGNPSKNKACSIMIVNLLEGDLTLQPATDTAGNPFLHHGIQTGHPAVCDPKGKKPPMAENQVPGKAQLDPDDPESLTCGVGFYRFEKDLGFLNMGVYGTGGAMAFTSSDPSTKGKVMAIAWSVPQKGDLGCGVTGDLSKYPSLKDFYEATAGMGNTNKKTEAGPQYNIQASIVACDYDSSTPAKTSEDDFILTVSVQRGN